MAVAPRVEFLGVNKTYDGRTMVVQDLDLRMEEGEFFTLLGPSGSGKTTCLMMLAGFEAPSSGEIRISRPLGATSSAAEAGHRPSFSELCTVSPYDGWSGTWRFPLRSGEFLPHNEENGFRRR